MVGLAVHEQGSRAGQIKGELKKRGKQRCVGWFGKKNRRDKTIGRELGTFKRQPSGKTNGVRQSRQRLHKSLELLANALVFGIRQGIRELLEVVVRPRQRTAHDLNQVLQKFVTSDLEHQ